ncbi:molybdate transport system ATP-binding protein [Nocardioides alpinus]|uniref:ABC transporter ATP-binding protein n=2 Tax=Nocardioides alpinus TaxID=748909 RepID=A0A1I0VM51_9ACTN|nr:ABC transporter ATP-binding protein [Nocardioides alpinus]SFA77077.1 molybdate transport system ATP-binding protein [Nocardioides alpinus]
MRVEVDIPGRVSADLEAAAGEVVVVIGPNGAGKSTLLRAIAGLEPGRVRVGDDDWTDLEVPRRRVGYVFQDQSLFPHLSALDNVAFGPRARGRHRREAEDLALGWLRRFGIAELAHRKPRELSGGQAQRVAIARALATDPDVLLLDEPFTGLDVSVQVALRIELGQHLRDFPGIALLVTHDAIDALTLADRVLVLDEGRVAQVGPPAEVAAEPRTPHVARLVGLNLVADGEDLIAFTPDAVTVSLAEPEGSSRLRWHGPIATLAPHGDAVRLLVHASPDLLADLTPAAATELALVPGREVWLSAKATAVSRYGAAATGR